MWSSIITMVTTQVMCVSTQIQYILGYGTRSNNFPVTKFCRSERVSVWFSDKDGAYKVLLIRPIYMYYIGKPDSVAESGEG